MKVLIIENEIYLAQSISIKLSDAGYSCEIINSFDERNPEKYYDIVLLSTNTSNFLKAVTEFKHSIIILLISYISTDTVSNPLKLGACDYIQKPFMIEELIRKIKHYQDFKKLSILNKAYKSYIKSRLQTVKIPEYNYKKLKLPVVLKSNKQSSADAFVFNYINEYDITLSYVDLSVSNSVEKAMKLPTENNLLFLSNFQVLKPLEREKLLEFIKNKSVILHTNSNIEDLELPCINLSDNEKNIDSNQILTIDEYVKYIILNYQNVFPDTDLSKKLGISRKSLWEKRKKYEISKKK
ncbi:response regulator transcription factor [Campylobacter coli]|uniref:Response regulator transcription factor n=1 Tax=Campylobacter coli TaxID=195 RepID=A0A381CEN1_CAMCO|nr:response regulator transcription factor [Campylobacter coli]EAK3887652.1 response regulator transcription factor [Campylobacter hyointestinalis]AHK72546.1 chemotaxis protein CheY [Campylobacter coli RM1875]EAB5223472.1 DNA-binding response regulator [Campylobacter coli]EAH8421480.1 response regulator transcription factor [Campylobacter coli]EAH9441840.1 response regulator transcription factor [Campylobacter coli]